MLDDLRKDALQHDFDEFEDEEDLVPDVREGAEKRFLGMTAVERMFLAIFFFLNVLVLGLLLLVATQRIVF